jgi:hypothetical protein
VDRSSCHDIFAIDKENTIGHFGPNFVHDKFDHDFPHAHIFARLSSGSFAGLTISRRNPFNTRIQQAKMMMKSVLLFSSAMMLTEAHRPLLRRTRRVAFAEFGRGIDPQKEAEK